MKTDDLIRALAADTQAEPPPPRLILIGLIPALAIAVALVWVTFGFRDDLLQSFGNPWSVMRFVLTGTLGLIGVRLALVLARPEGRGLGLLWPFAAVAAVALGLLVWAYLATPAEGRQMALLGKTLVTCLVAIPVLSILPVTAILVALRKGATTTPALAGFVAGLGGSGFGAMAYSVHCVEDSPLFYVTWYGLAMVGVTLVSTLIGARFLRW
ncbi:MAG: DUF1109 domain-containing protein [Rhodobacter sp.]|nr:DUF1109 domain-containing protein [Rhodobacter sp.]